MAQNGTHIGEGSKATIEALTGAAACSDGCPNRTGESGRQIVDESVEPAARGVPKTELVFRTLAGASCAASQEHAVFGHFSSERLERRRRSWEAWHGHFTPVVEATGLDDALAHFHRPVPTLLKTHRELFEAVAEVHLKPASSSVRCRVPAFSPFTM
jgi:hypothetical protein